MSILTQIFTNFITSNKFPKLESTTNELMNPLTTLASSMDYGNFIQNIATVSYDIARFTIKALLEKTDEMFLNMPDRTTRYHVKATRYRTIVTPFGDVRYKRTIYSFVDGTPGTYCHVDRSFGIPKYDHYDPCVKAMVVSLYADHNSMIKVGKIVGERIYSPFSLGKDKTYYKLSRQTVQHIIKTSNRIYYPFPKRESTPDTLYIMADEKFIPLQSHDENNKVERKMVKAAVIFEDIGLDMVNGSIIHPRHKLINKFIYFNSENHFWDGLYERMNELYDLEKVKHIWVLGDGASWIKNGIYELSNTSWETNFALDKFHFNQSLTRISKDSDIRNELFDSIVNQNDKKQFKHLINTIIENALEREDTIRKQEEYILSNWKHIQTSYKTVYMGCSMESAISHYICSSFTSVPKAYMEHNLPHYLDNRMYLLNDVDLMSIYLQAKDIAVDKKGKAVIKESLDFSIFSPSKSYNSKDGHNIYGNTRDCVGI